MKFLEPEVILNCKVSSNPNRK